MKETMNMKDILKSAFVYVYYIICGVRKYTHIYMVTQWTLDRVQVCHRSNRINLVAYFNQLVFSCLFYIHLSYLIRILGNTNLPILLLNAKAHVIFLLSILYLKGKCISL